MGAEEKLGYYNSTNLMVVVLTFSSRPSGEGGEETAGHVIRRHDSDAGDSGGGGGGAGAPGHSYRPNCCLGRRGRRGH